MRFDQQRLRNRIYIERCMELAKENPDWTIARVEAEAAKEGIMPTTQNPTKTVPVAPEKPTTRRDAIMALLNEAQRQAQDAHRHVLLFAPKQKDADDVREHTNAVYFILQTVKGMI